MNVFLKCYSFKILIFEIFIMQIILSIGVGLDDTAESKKKALTTEAAKPVTKRSGYEFMN